MPLGYLDPGSGSVLIQSFIFVILWIGPSVLVASYASNKGHSFALFLILGLLLSWLIALVVALLVEDRRPAPQAGAQGSEDHLDQLKKLTELRDAGTLSDAEFEDEKARILAARQS